MERSVGSPLALAGGVAETFAGGGCELAGTLAEGWPGVAGAAARGWLVCGEAGCGLGAKNFAQTTITIIDSREATRMRNCGLRPNSFLFGFCGVGESLTETFRPSLLRW